MYGLGMSLRDISHHIKEMYDTDISHSTLSSITDKIIPEIKEWQSRSLDSLYTIVWMDAILNYMSKIGYELVNTFDLTDNYNGSGGSSGIIYLMKRVEE